MFLTRVKTLTAVVLGVLLAAGVVLVGHALAFPVQTQDQAGKREAANVPAIKQIVVSGSGNVIFQQGGKQTLIGATADAVKDGVLRLTGNDDVAVDMKELPEVLLQGQGNFIGKDIQAKRAVFVIQGSGKLDLSGTTEELSITVQGSGTFDGRKLKGKQGTVSIGGNGDVLVNVTDTLKANVGGSGNVRYLGAPKVEESIGGTGKVRQYREGDGPSTKPPARIVPDSAEERLRQLEAELKKLRDELKQKNP